MTQRRWFRIVAAAGVAASLAGSAAAQGEGMAAGPDRMQKMIQEIRELLDRAEAKRQADPWLIRDIRDVLAQYAFPWTRTVYAAEFRGEGGIPEGWRVANGTFRLTAAGWRSVVPTPRETAQTQRDRNEKTQGRGDGQVRDLISSMLDQALNKPAKQKEDKRSEPTDSAQPAVARLPQRTANAFAARIQVTLGPGSDVAGFVFGPYQGEAAEAGYRMVYALDGGNADLELIKRSPRGTEATVDRADVPALTDGEKHTLLWTRDPQGRMQIDLDGDQVIDVTDRGFQDPFSGFSLTNTAGTFTVRSLVIKDAP